jgi:hypothetical protein
MSDEADKTRIINRPLDRLQGPPAETPPDLDRTGLVENRPGSGRPPLPSSSGADEGKTVLFRPPPKGGAASEGAASSSAAPSPGGANASKDPVVGWLVVMKGPGRGNSVQLGYGWNSIGRDTSQRVCLDYGDSQITRLNHAKILYDPRGRKFSLTLGEGTNPTYVRGEALLAPTELQSGDQIQIGDTELLFVGLCGPNFDWSDEA